MTTGLDRLFVGMINDPRDLDFVYLVIQCAICAAGGISLFFAGEYTWYLAPVYWAVWAFWVLDRYILMLHCTSHRTLFTKKWRRLNVVIPWFLAPFFGETPETYFTHHLGMHHPENNLHDDLSSTMVYKRDRLDHWLRYFGRFFLLGVIDVPSYFFKRKQTKMALRFIVGEGTWYVAVVLLCLVNWQATLIVFIIPVIVVRFLMMAGNWGQHAFVDGDDAANPYRNSLTCINSRYNRRCFNDGYHIHHHVKARAHWTDLATEFETNKGEYGRQDAIVFEKIDFFIVWLFLMLKRYDWLARCFVQLPGAPERSREDVITFLKSRLEPIPVAVERPNTAAASSA